MFGLHNETKSNIFSEKKGVHKMKKKERVKDYGKLIIDLVDKIDDQNKLKRIYQFVKYIYVHS